MLQPCCWLIWIWFHGHIFFVSAALHHFENAAGLARPGRSAGEPDRNCIEAGRESPYGQQRQQRQRAAWLLPLPR